MNNIAKPDLETVFSAALAKQSPEERAAYLEQACAGDEDLRRSVERLLNAYPIVGSFLEPPAADLAVTTESPPITETTGTVIGPYKLLQQIGEGGMGVVFVAEQERPVRRKVALKVIKPGMDTRQVIARFEAERQALAMMDHPNIAKVFDAGATENGRPYFVMELVQGVAITEYCDQCNLTTRERLELFVTVCHAVQHAHQKGVIHRDIKPTNVLVAVQDGRPASKIIDFGVAKAIEQRLTEHTLTTAFAQMVGSPLYMSPEQAELSPMGVDTRSDIYSLGVLLYELLTGATPFDKDRLHAARYDELRRIIRDEEPPRPSARISTLAADLATTVAERRRTEAHRLVQTVRGELDWIVMKALEKDRNRRYETASGLAIDVQRYLAGEAVQAVPPSTAYRVKKFVRRNKGPVLAAALVLLTLVAGIVGTSIGLVRAQEARRAEAARAEGERRAKEQAEANFAIANDAVEKYLGTVTNDRDLKRADFIQLRKKLVESAIPFFQQLTERKSDDPAVEARRGRGYWRLGLLRHALGESEAAIQDFEASRSIFARLTAEFPTVPTYHQGLAESLNDLAKPLIRLGRRPQAEAAYRQATTIFDKLAAEFPHDPVYRSGLAMTVTSLGNLLADSGDRPKAEEAYRKAVGIMERLAAEFPNKTSYQTDLAGSHHNFGNWLSDDWSRHEEAEAAYRRALDIYAKLPAESLDNPQYLQTLPAIHTGLGQLLMSQQKYEKAEAAFRQALDIQEKLAARFHSEPTHREHLALVHDNLGNVLGHQGKYEESEASHLRAVEIREQLVRDFPNDPQHAFQLGLSYNNYGALLINSDRNDEALDWFKKAIAQLEPVVAGDERLVIARTGLRNSHRGRAQALDALGRRDKATPDWERALELDDGSKALFIRQKISRNKKDAAGCLAAAAEYEARKHTDAGALYTAACYRADCAAVIPEDPKTPAADATRLAREQADLAMAWLQKAVVAGYRDAAHMKNDDDLAPLREREDFKRLLEALEDKKK